MTDIRATLNKIAPAVEQLACHQQQADADGVMVTVSRQAVDEVVSAINEIAISLSAAPGEPCAVKPLEWRDHRPDSFPEPAWSAQTPFGFYNIEEVSASDSPAYVVRLHAHHFVADKDGLDEAKAAAQADYEKRIRSALVTTPQPTAGWDDLPKRPFAFAVKRAPENGEDQWRLFMSEADARAEAEQLDGDYEGLYRVGDRRSAVESIRHEAPAPAEGNSAELARWCYSNPNLAALTIEGLRSHTRPDTAEARLREALDVAHGKFCKIAGTEVWTDGCLDGWRRSPGALREYAERAASEIDNALSPPSGGDEATTCTAAEMDAIEQAAMAGKPLTDPPADRREIVARIIRSKTGVGATKNGWGVVGIDEAADAIIAAFDGGR